MISKSQLAVKLGVSRARVSQLVRMGLPVRPDGMIDEAAALAWHAQHFASSHTAAPLNGDAPAADAQTPEPGESKGPTRADAQTDYWAAKAREKQLDLEERERSLLPAEETERGYHEQVLTVVNRLLLVGDKVADDVALATDPMTCRSIIDHAIREALAEIAAGAAGGATELAA